MTSRTRAFECQRHNYNNAKQKKPYLQLVVRKLFHNVRNTDLTMEMITIY
jgi:hypothetical protein